MNAIDKAAPAKTAAVESRPDNGYPASIAKALHEVMSAVGYVQKKGRNEFQKYNYAGEGNLLEVLRPAMLEAGLLLIPSGKTKSPVDEHGITHVEVEYTMLHKDGSVWPEKIIAYGDGGDKNSKGVGDKGLYKALTGANKYLLFKLFQIETGDDPEKDSDNDKHAAPVAEVDPTKVKNAPGVSEAKTWAREHLRELNASESPEHFMEQITAAKPRWAKICAVYPHVWAGPDGSGLRGEGLKLATVWEARDAYVQFVKEVEILAKEVEQQKAAQ